MKKNLYEFIGVNPRATTEEIKIAASRLAQKHNPKKYPNDPQVAAYFKQIKQAYHILTDPQKRADYNASLAGSAQPNSSIEKLPPTAPIQLSLQEISPEKVPKKAKKARAYSHWFIYAFSLLLIGTAVFLLWIEPHFLDHYLAKNALLRQRHSQVRLGLQIALGLGSFLLFYALSLHLRTRRAFRDLLVGERVTYRASTHLAIYILPLLLTSTAAYLLFVDQSLLNSYLMKIEFFQDKSAEIELGLQVLLGLGGLMMLYALTRHFTTTLMVTSKRTLFQSGLIFKDEVEIDHERFENLEIRRGIIGKVLFFGTVDIRGTGSRGVGGQRIRVPYVAFPGKFKNRLFRSLRSHYL